MASETSLLPSLVGISRFGIAAEVQEAAAASGAEEVAWLRKLVAWVVEQHKMKCRLQRHSAVK